MSNDDEQQQQNNGDDGGEGKTFDAAYVRSLRDEAAKWRTKARENQSAAEELGRIQEADKTELQKANERAEKAERDAEKANAAATRAHIAAKHGISGDYLDLLHGEDEEQLENAAKKLSELISNGHRGDGFPHVPSQGDHPKAVTDQERLARQVLLPGS